MDIIIPRYEGNVLGLRPRTMVITNSERETSGCPLKWLFAYGRRLKSRGLNVPMSRGNGLHLAVEDVHLWWMKHDTAYPGDGDECVWCSGGCEVCEGTGLGPIAKCAAEWKEFAWQKDSEYYTPENAIEDEVRVMRMLEGWLKTYGAEPDEEYRVVSPELKMATPIVTPAGRPYNPEQWITPTDTGWRLAGVGEAHLPGSKKVRWRWAQCLTVDALLQHREFGGLMVYELKSAKSPSKRMSAVSVDPQVSGYVHGVRHAVLRGLIPGIGRDVGVSGYIYDVVSSSLQKDPHLLKPKKVKLLGPDGEPFKRGRGWAYEMDSDGMAVERSPGFSKNENAGVPSWRYQQAIEREGFNPSDYEDHMMSLMMGIDTRLYLRETGSSGPAVGARYSRELFATARKIAGWRRRAAEMQTPEEQDVHFPRLPVCIAGYGCAYRAPCLQDGEVIRSEYDVADGVEWHTKAKPKQAAEEEVFEW